LACTRSYSRLLSSESAPRNCASSAWLVNGRIVSLSDVIERGSAGADGAEAHPDSAAMAVARRSGRFMESRMKEGARENADAR